MSFVSLAYIATVCYIAYSHVPTFKKKRFKLCLEKFPHPSHFIMSDFYKVLT